MTHQIIIIFASDNDTIATLLHETTQKNRISRCATAYFRLKVGRKCAAPVSLFFCRNFMALQEHYRRRILSSTQGFICWMLWKIFKIFIKLGKMVNIIDFFWQSFVWIDFSKTCLCWFFKRKKYFFWIIYLFDLFQDKEYNFQINVGDIDTRGKRQTDQRSQLMDNLINVS